MAVTWKKQQATDIQNFRPHNQAPMTLNLPIKINCDK